MLETSQIQAAIQILDDSFGLDGLYVYGSVAEDRERNDSDVDLAAVLRSTPNAFDLARARADLSGAIGREVDLVLLDRVSPITAMQVLRKGRRLYASTTSRLAELEVRIMSQYADLKRVRASAEASLIKRVLDG